MNDLDRGGVAAAEGMETLMDTMSKVLPGDAHDVVPKGTTPKFMYAGARQQLLYAAKTDDAEAEA
jgi:hypothetical protein